MGQATTLSNETPSKVHEPSATERVKQFIEEVKSCSITEISTCFSRALDSFKYIPKPERKELIQSLQKWAEAIAASEPHKFQYAEALRALNHFMNEELEASLGILTGTRKYFATVNDSDGGAITDMLIGAIYRTFGNFDLALKNLWQAYGVMNQTGSYPNIMAACCNSLANINLEMHNYEEAEKLFTQCNELSSKTGDFYFNIYSLHGLGKVNMLQKNPAQAQVFLEKALKSAEENKFPMQVANSLSELSNFHFQNGDLATSEKLNKQALSIRKKNNFTSAAVTSCIHLGEIYIKQKRWKEALEVLNNGLSMAEQLKVKPKIYPIHLLLSQIYKSNQEWEKSLHHYEIFHELHEKVQQEDSARKLSDAKLIFEAEQTKKENIIIKKQKEEIQKKNIELQETIDELTIAKVSRKAKALTLGLAIVLFIFEDPILGFALKLLSSDNYFLSLFIKMAIIFSLSPINRAMEHYLLKKVILKKKKEAKEKAINLTSDPIPSIG